MKHCKRCNHSWKQKKKEKPSICPRCKTKKWDEKKVRKWEEQKDEGYLYCVLFRDSTIKVGKTIDPFKRISKHKEFKKVNSYFVSSSCYDSSKCERKLIKEATKICGASINNSREYFCGTYSDYGGIVLFIKRISKGNELATTKTTKEIKEGSELLFFAANGEHFAKMNKAIDVRVYNERKQFALSVHEALEDYVTGACTSEISLRSLQDITSKMLLDMHEKLKNNNYLESTYEDVKDELVNITIG